MNSTTTASGRAGGRFGGMQQPRARKVGGVCEPGGVATDDAQPGAAVATGHELLDPSVVETAARRTPVLDEHLCKIAAVLQRMVERRL